MIVLPFLRMTFLSALIVGLLTAPVFQAQQADPTIVHPKVARVDFDMQKVAEPPPMDETQLKGRRLFFQHCGLCHASGGRANTYGPWLDEGTIKKIGEAKFQSVLSGTHPARPGRKASRISPAEVDQIIAFVKIGPPAPPPPSRTP